MEKLSSAERLLRTVRGEPVDRVPILSPLDWTPLSPDPAPGSWRDDPNYRSLIPFVAEHCDFFVDTGIPEGSTPNGTEGQAGYETLTGGIFDRRFFLIPPEYVEVAEQGVRGSRRYVTYVVHILKGDLRETDEFPSDIDTTWIVEPLIKDVDDAEKILSVPYRFDKPNLEAFFAKR